MIDIIENNIKNVEVQRSELKQVVSRKFDSVQVEPKEIAPINESKPSKGNGLSTILYCAGAASLVGTLFQDEKSVALISTGALLIGAGYMSSRKSKVQTAPKPTIDYLSIRLDTSEKTTQIVKDVTALWEQFMTTQQKEVFAVIEHAEELTSDQKYQKSSSIFLYEKLNFPLTEIVDEFRSISTNSPECIVHINAIKEKAKHLLDEAIDKTIDEQVKLYSNLLIN